MPQIDLKNVTVRLKDGGTQLKGKTLYAASEETFPASAAAGETTVTIATMAAAHVVGEKFTLSKDGDATPDTTVYTVTEEVAAGSAVDLKFTPALWEDSAAKTAKFEGLSAGVDKITVNTTPALPVANFQVGDTVDIKGSDLTYLIAAVNGTTNASSIEISPALDTLIASAADITISKLPQHIDVETGEGNFSYSEKKNRTYTLSRGKLDTVRDGDEAPMEVSFDLTWKWLKSAGEEDPTVEEVLKRIGPAANWRSTADDPCEPYCVDIELFNAPGCGSEGLNETIIFPNFRYESVDYDAKNGTVAVSGKCNATEAIHVRNTAANRAL